MLYGNEQPSNLPDLSGDDITTGLIDAFVFNNDWQRNYARLVGNATLTTTGGAGSFAIADRQFGRSMRNVAAASTQILSHTAIDATLVTFACRFIWNESVATTLARVTDGSGYSIPLGFDDSTIRFNAFGTVNGAWTAPMTLNAPQLLVLTFDSTASNNKPKMWINGSPLVVTETVAYTGPHTSDAGTRYFFDRNLADRGMNGTIEFFYEWNRILDDNEIAQISDSPYSVFAAPARRYRSTPPNAFPPELFAQQPNPTYLRM